MEAAATAGRGPAPLPALVYEREPGAASRPLPAGYRRREPEHTVRNKVVREHLETFLAEARAHSESGAGYPAFVEHELRRFLDCGQLSRGFSRLRCPQCGAERLVAFSCKSRSCPLCFVPAYPVDLTSQSRLSEGTAQFAMIPVRSRAVHAAPVV